MNIISKWKTIKIINVSERETPIWISTKPIDRNETFPEYRIHVGSNHLKRHLDITEQEVLTSSETKKMKRFTIKNYYGMEFEIELQERKDHEEA